MRGAALAVVLAMVSTLVALGAFVGIASATCAAGAQYDEYGNVCSGGSGGSQYGQYTPPGSGGSQYGQYTPPGSGGSQYTPPGSGGSQYTPPGSGGTQYTPAGGAAVVEWKSESLDVPSGTDAVRHADVRMGIRSWEGALHNWTAATTVTGGEVTLGTTSPAWSFNPPISLPLHSGPADVPYLGTPVSAHTPDASGVSLSTGYDFSRTFDTTTIPGGGGRETVTLSLTVRDPALVGSWVQLNVDANWYGGYAAQLDTTGVTTSSVAAPAFAGSPFLSSNHVDWQINGAQLDATYTLTVPIDVANSSTAPFSYKPMTRTTVGIDHWLPSVTGNSTEIADPELGGAWQFHTTTPVVFERRTTLAVQTNLEPVSVPSYTLAVDHPDVTVRPGGHFAEHVTVTPLNGFTGDANFFTGDADGSFSPPAVQIYVNPWPSPLSVGPAAGSWDLQSDVNPFVTPGDYTIYYGAWSNSAPAQWTPVTVHVLQPLPRAFVKDARTLMQEFGPAVDSVASSSASSNGSRHWRGELWNFCGNALDVPAPQIRLAQPAVSWAFEPPVVFPLVQALGHDLSPCNQLQLGAIDGYDQNTQQQSSSVSHQTVVTGYDGQRATSTTTVPPGGLDQTVTTTITLRDARYLHGWANIEVRPNWFGPGPASIDTATVTQEGVTTENPSYWQFGPQAVSWTLNDAKLNTPYTLTLHVHIPNDGTSSFEYKPAVILRGGWDTMLPPVDGASSTTIADDLLQSSFTFSAGGPVDWSRDLADSIETQLRPVLAPPYTIAVAHPTLQIRQGETATQPTTLTPLNGFTGNLNFFLSGGPDANGDWTQGPNGIYPDPPFPQDVSIGPTGSVDLALGIHVDGSVAPGTYTVAVSGYGSNTPLQFGTFTVQVLPAIPEASAGDSRIATIASTGDGFAATQSAAADLTFNPYILLRNAGVATLHAPQITATSSLTFAPPVAMPHTESGADLDGSNRFFEMTALAGDFTFSGSSGHSKAVGATVVAPGFDLARSASPASIPAAGGTQTVTVSITPRRAAGFATLTVDPASVVPGATVDALTVVPPAADPTGAADVTFGPGNGSVIWSASAAVGTTYTLTVTVHVPAQPGTRLVKPAVIGEVESISTLGTDTGTSTGNADSLLGGTIAYSSTDTVRWTRVLLDTYDVKLAGGSTPAASVDHFVVRSSASRVSTGKPFAVTVTAKNAANRTVTSYTGPVALDDTAHTLSLVGPIAWSAGIGTATVTLQGPLDADRVTATDTGDSPTATGTSGNIVVIGPATHFKVATPAGPVGVGAPLQVTVRALDALDRLVVDYAGPVTFTEITAGHEDALAPSMEAWAGGIDTVTLALPTPSRSARIMVGTTGGLVSGQSRALVVLGPVTQLRVRVAPTSVVVRTGVLTVTSTALDAAGNVIDGFADPLSYADLSSPSAVHVFAAGTWDQGVLVARMTIGTRRTGDTITARSTVDASIAGTSSSFTVR